MFRITVLYVIATQVITLLVQWVYRIRTRKGLVQLWNLTNGTMVILLL